MLSVIRKKLKHIKLNTIIKKLSFMFKNKIEIENLAVSAKQEDHKETKATNVP